MSRLPSVTPNPPTYLIVVYPFESRWASYFETDASMKVSRQTLAGVDTHLCLSQEGRVEGWQDATFLGEMEGDDDIGYIDERKKV